MKRQSLLLSLLLTFVTLGLGACAAGGDGPGQVADGAEQADGVTQLDGYHQDGVPDTTPGDGTPGDVTPGVDGKVPDGEGQPDGGPGGASIHGRLAAPAAPDQRNFSFGDRPGASAQVPKSLSLVSVDLLRADQGTPPANWTVEKNALPDQDGAFAFEGLTEGNYALRVNQPEFAALAYSVDSTEFHLGADQSVSLVLPLLTTITHGLTDPRLRQSQNGPPPLLATLDHGTGEVQNYQSTANLTISGENRPLIVEKDGEVNLTAGKSIILLPGTKISAGGFLYASIEPSVKSGKHQKKEIRLVTIEENEKIQEQASLSQAGILFSPFPKSVKGSLHAGDAEQGYFNISANILSAVAPEQHRKVALISLPLHEITRQQVFSNLTILPVTSTFRAETMRVLRL